MSIEPYKLSQKIYFAKIYAYYQLNSWEDLGKIKQNQIK